MTKLTDTQLVILSAACAREDGAVFPITASVKGGALNKVLQSLIAKRLIEEIPAGVGDTIWRDEDEGRVTLRATDAACEALGIEDNEPPPSGGAGAGAAASEPDPIPLGAAAPRNSGNVAATGGGKARKAVKGRRKTKAATSANTGDSGKTRSGTKQELLISMLRRKSGATIYQIVEATGWQKHTARGAMAGALKKRLGLTIESEKVEGRGRVYRIVD